MAQRRIRINNMRDLAEYRTRHPNRGYRLAGADFLSANLPDIQLQYSDLSDANFTNAILNFGRFQHSHLQGANFRNARLERADFSYTDLSGANFDNAELKYANFEGANLEGANFRDASLLDANFRGANVYRANLRDAIDAPRLRTNVRTVLPHLSPPTSPTPWTQDADCVGQDDPVSMDTIPEGSGFRLEAENRCYDIETVAQMNRLGMPSVGPMTRKHFTPQDQTRIAQYVIINPTAPSREPSQGGKKRKTKRTRRKTRRTRRRRK